MAFVVTARKWRPQKFNEVVGQEHITATLKNAIKNNRIAHAYLFTGPRGVGKTTTARILAKTMNCLNPKDFEPCNECEMCKSIQSGQSMDIIEIDGASNRGIDEIRTLRDSVKYAPTKSKFKIYIIDEVHMLTKESFNAFLKTLEEPPAHTIFIFATTDVHKVPLTIISRCQRFDFRRIQLDTIKALLAKIAKEEKIDIDDKTLTIIAKKADGALRDAESFFDQVVSFCEDKIDSETVSKMLNLVDDEIYFLISDAVLERNFKAVFDVTEKIYENGWNFIDFTDGLIEHFRNIMTVVLSQNTGLVETADVYRTRYMDYIDKFSEGDILRILNFLSKTQQELRYTQNQKLKVEISLTQLIGLERSATISDVLEKLSGVKETGGTPRNVREQPQSSYQNHQSYSVPAKPQPKRTNTAAPKSAPKPSSPKTASLNNNSISSGEIGFESIVQKWEGFVEAVKSEKGLILGPFMQSIKLLRLEGNSLVIAVDDSHGKEIIEHQQEYIASKTHEYFGKKMKFSVMTEAARSQPANDEIHEKSKSSSPKPKKNDTNDPYITAIINELGGEEIG